jgi:hypothetical protein
MLPETISFHFGPDDEKLEIGLSYSTKETVFSLKIHDKSATQAFTNIFGDPTVLNIISNRDAGTLAESYPDDAERMRFVKGVLYVWTFVKLSHLDYLGDFSKLVDKKKIFEDYTHREMLENVVAPVLQSIRDGRRHLPDMSEAILLFSDTASREICEFLVHEVDEKGIFEEEEFKTEFKERLTQVNATLAIKAVQALAASDIDKISEIGNTIQELHNRKVDLPEFLNLQKEFRELCEKIRILGEGKGVEIHPDFVTITTEFAEQRDRMHREIEEFMVAMKATEKSIEEKKREICQTPPVANQQTKIMRNLSRKQMKVIEKMFSEDD